MLLICDRTYRFDSSKLLDVYAESIMKASKNIRCDSEYIALRTAENDFLQYITGDFYRSNGGIIAIWEEDGRYACAARVEPYRDGFLLSGLETAPNLRKKGYATKLLSGVIAHLECKVQLPLYSHIHKHNAASLSIHRKLGFEMISDVAVLLDGTVSSAYITLVFNRKNAL